MILGMRVRAAVADAIGARCLLAGVDELAAVVTGTGVSSASSWTSPRTSRIASSR